MVHSQLSELGFIRALAGTFFALPWAIPFGLCALCGASAEARWLCLASAVTPAVLWCCRTSGWRDRDIDPGACRRWWPFLFCLLPGIPIARRPGPRGWCVGVSVA